MKFTELERTTTEGIMNYLKNLTSYNITIFNTINSFINLEGYLEYRLKNNNLDIFSDSHDTISLPLNDKDITYFSDEEIIIICISVDEIELPIYSFLILNTGEYTKSIMKCIKIVRTRKLTELSNNINQV